MNILTKFQIFVICASLIFVFATCEEDEEPGDKPPDLQPPGGFHWDVERHPLTFNRLIPLRIIEFICPGKTPNITESELQTSVDAANKAFSRLGISFYVAQFANVHSSSMRCAEGPHSWGDVKHVAREIYPHIPLDAWDDSVKKPGDGSESSNWLRAIVSVYGYENEIFIVTYDCGGNATDSVNAGRLLRMTRGHIGHHLTANGGNGTLQLFAHELGHYMGLSHPFATQGGTDPKTDNPWTSADRWELVWASTLGGPVFFNYKSGAEQYLSDLQNIVKRRAGVACTIDSDCHDGFPCTLDICNNKVCRYDTTDCGWPYDWGCNCVELETNGQPDGRLKCVLALVETAATGKSTWLPYSHNGQVFIYETGDHEIRGLSFDSGEEPDPPDKLRYGRNVMDYGEMTGPRGISDSQVFISTRFLNYEASVTNSFLNNIGTFPTGFSEKDVRPARSKLGIIRDHWDDQDINICTNEEDTLYVGDFDGNGQDDLLCNSTMKWMTIYLSDSKGRFGTLAWRHLRRDFCIHDGETMYIGNFDGIGGDDVLCNNKLNGAMHVDLNNVEGAYFMDSDWVYQRDFCSGPSDELFVGDFNGDGRDDILCNKINGNMEIDLANENGEFWSNNWEMADRYFCMHAGEILYIGNFDGEEGDDLLCNNVLNGWIRVDLSDEEEFFPGSDFKAGRNFCNQETDELIVLDINGDGRKDILCRNRVSGMVQIDLADSKGEFRATNFTTEFDNWCAGLDNKVFAGHFDSFIYNNKNHEDIMCHTSNGGLKIEYSAFALSNWSF